MPKELSIKCHVYIDMADGDDPIALINQLILDMPEYASLQVHEHEVKGEK